MNDSGFYGRFYRDFLFGYRPKVTRYFWMKELNYTVFDMLKTLPKMNFNIRRHVRLILFLLTEREKYNQKVWQIVDICRKLAA